MLETPGRKPRILVVGAINRPDILRMFEEARAVCDLTFLEYRYNYGHEADAAIYAPYGRLIFWSDYNDSLQLLNDIKPDKVVFIFVESYLQITLNALAQKLNIKTIYLEHGIRLPYKYQIEMRSKVAKTQQPLTGPEKIASLKNYWHLINSAPRAGIAFSWRLLSLLVRGRFQKYSMELLTEFAAIRKVDEYISYSPMIFEFTKQFYQLDAQTPVQHIGIPQFDHLFQNKSAAPSQDDTLLFIGSQLHNGGLLGWNQENYGPFVEELFSKVRQAGFQKIYLKLHPGDVHPVWEALRKDPRVEVVNLDGLPDAIARSGLIIAFYSTMLLPVAAAPNATIFVLENHPKPEATPLSQQFVEHKVAEVVNTLKDLDELLARKAEIYNRQAANKQRFVSYALTYTDGKAQQRLAEILGNTNSQKASPQP